MFGRLNNSVAALADAGPGCLADRLVGLEKESLRVSIAGTISQRDHPVSLGAALTHPHITTDFGEAMLEFVTPPFHRSQDTVDFLTDLHRFAVKRLDRESLWAASMPCVLDGERSVRIGEYGSSNAGLMKHVYRKGLGLRYGKSMQVISGIHINLSWPEALWAVLARLDGHEPSSEVVSAGYLHAIRNVQRHGWLLLYLFGASPAICTSFLGGETGDLERWDDSTVYRPYGTTLRMSDLGYRNSDKAPVRADYNSLAGYVASLRSAISTHWPAYDSLGVQAGETWQQLNANMLQIENEYYSGTRPKQIAEHLEKPSTALARRGVEYIELRTLDVNPFAMAGIDTESLRFVEAFALFCLLHDSRPFDGDERDRIDRNSDAVANFGRDPALTLVDCDEQSKPLAEMAGGLVDAIQSVASCIGPEYVDAVAVQMQKIENPDSTPSGQILQGMRDSRMGFFQFAQSLSAQHDQSHRGASLSAEREGRFEEDVARSLAKRDTLEAEAQAPFADFIAEYLASE